MALLLPYLNHHTCLSELYFSLLPNMSQTQGNVGEHSRFAHLSQAHPEWSKVASKQRALEPLAQRLYSLPLEEFRKVPYGPPPLPANTPVPGIDIIIREDEVIVRDGAKVKVRIYEPVHLSSCHLLFFNIHGGGSLACNANLATLIFCAPD